MSSFFLNFRYRYSTSKNWGTKQLKFSFSFHVNAQSAMSYFYSKSKNDQFSRSFNFKTFCILVPADSNRERAMNCGRSSTGTRHRCSVCLKFGMKTQFEHIDFHADFHVFWLQYWAVCLQYVTSWVFGVHSFQGKQLSFSRYISQCILSVMHDAMYQDFTVTCTSCSQNFHVLLFEFILLLIWWFKKLSSLSAVIRQLEETVSSWLATNFLLKICMTSFPAPLPR